jgi:hypothetical protein
LAGGLEKRFPCRHPLDPSADPSAEASSWHLSAQDIPLPTHHFGKPIAWTDGFPPPPVFIGVATLPNGRTIALHGVRYNLARRSDLPPDSPVPSGYFVNYVVLFSAAPADFHVLRQWRSSTWQTGEETKDSVFPSDLKKKERAALCSGAEPAWKASEAQWPLDRGAPMRFVAQFVLPENEVTRQWLTFNEAVFLFWNESDGVATCKITTQEMKFQSAEDHYRVEAKRLSQKQNPS